MSLATISQIAICFVACDVGPAAHFAAFKETLENHDCAVTVLATGAALKKFGELGIEVTDFNPDALDIANADNQKTLAQAIARTSHYAQIVITDSGKEVMAQVHRAIQSMYGGEVSHDAYYDNGEDQVPGGYSDAAAKVASVAQQVLFSNIHHVTEPLYRDDGKTEPIDLPQEKRIGIGYYPLEDANRIKNDREQNHSRYRKEFLDSLGRKDTRQTILVYFGANNTAYFEREFDCFLRMVERAHLDPEKYILVFQQHGAAKTGGDRDGKRLAQWQEKNADHIPRVIVSSKPYSWGVALGDRGFYFQTSLSPQFVIAGLDCGQVSEQPYTDSMVRANFVPSMHTPEAFKAFLAHGAPRHDTDQVQQYLGVAQDWQERLQNACQL